MDDYTGVEACIEHYKKSEETIRKAGLKPQEPAAVVMKTMKAVGIRITNVSISSLIFLQNGVLSNYFLKSYLNFYN